VIKYSKDIEEKMQSFYASLDEAGKRRYASLEAEKLGVGGKTYIHKLFGCDYKTLVKGCEELKAGELFTSKIRQSGGGRKSKVEDPKVNEVFLEVLAGHTAGDPSDEKVKWTYLNQEEIATCMRQKGCQVSRYVVKRLLLKHDFVKRRSQKKSLGEKPEPE